jgi:uncharacterized Zn finger protein
MKKRLTFACWNCPHSYSLLREIEGWPKLMVECPFCGQEGIADLDPYREQRVEVFKNDKADIIDVGEELKFPDKIPTKPPKA